ncbi:MAG: LemA family protein [Candidatus Bathyarchaeota archaeon]|nr:LemA family protein [Candidatus Bathyarchaeota archaeon]
MSAPPTSGPPILLLIGAIVALACLFVALRYLSRKRLIDDTPTSKAQGVFIGLVELKGTAESEAPLTSYLAGERCVHYEWEIEEQWSRQVTETYQDANGKTQTWTRTESGWTNVGHDGEQPPFYLKDDTGVIRVVPMDADIEGVSSIDEVFGRGDPIYYGKGPPNAVANSDHRRRFRETVIPLHSAIYVMGQARERQDTVAPEIAHDDNAPLFVISTNTEKQISGGYDLWFALLLVVGLVAAVLGSVASSSMPGGLNWLTPASIYLVIAAFGWLWVVFNSLVSLRNNVDHAGSLIDVQLKRRSDLIPNLVSIVEGFHVHEEDTQVLVAELRAQESAEALKGLATMLSATVERYPDLVAGETFLHLQRSLVETEQRIALARDYFNEMAFFYNTRLVIMPDSIVGKMTGLRPRPLLKAENFERAPVEVKLVN